MSLIVVAGSIAGSLPLLRSGWSRGPLPITELDPLFALLWVGGAACAIGAALQAKFHRLAALIMVGGVGLVTCLTFAWYLRARSRADADRGRNGDARAASCSACAGCRGASSRRPARSAPCGARARRARDLVLALGAGAGPRALAFAVLTRAPDGALAPFFLANALEQAGGRTSST